MLTPNLVNIWNVLTLSFLIIAIIGCRNVIAQESTIPPVQSSSNPSNEGYSDVATTAEMSTTEITTTMTTTEATTTTEEPKAAINIAYFYQETDTMRSFDAAVQYVTEKFPDLTIGKVIKILSDGSKDSQQLCTLLGEKRPDIVIDFTRHGATADPVKTLSKGLKLPTISASYGQEDDIKPWRRLSSNMNQYLIQVVPPADVIIQSMRSIVDELGLTSAVLLYDEQYEVYHKYKSLIQNLPCRHMLTKIARGPQALRAQLDRLVHVDIANYFIAATVNEITQYLAEASDPYSKDGPYFSDEFAWYSMSLESGYPACVGCNMNASLVHLQPVFEYNSPRRKKFLTNLRTVRIDSLTELFYFDLAVDAILSVERMKKDNKWRDPPSDVSCSQIGYKDQDDGYELDLMSVFREIAGEGGQHLDNILGGFRLGGNGQNYPKIKLILERMLFIEHSARPYERKTVGFWNAGFGGKEHLTLQGGGLLPHKPLTVFRVITVIQHPFVYRNEKCMANVNDKYSANNCYYGYCIELFKKIVRELDFNYTIRNVSEYGYMSDDPPHDWSGMVRELKDRRADIALGALSVMAERESVIDFTVPFYDLVGISVLMRKTKPQTSLFKFLTVLENDVWMCILGSYFITSFVIWAYDRVSPMSYHNNSEAYPNEEDQRDFNLKECLWFSMTSLTPQGGGEAPKNLSGRIIAATWWAFGFILIASYTANLAAFLTVTRLEVAVESLEDLSKQYKVQYAPVKGSTAWIYFDRMSRIEHRFTSVWKDLSLNDSLPAYERAMISVWDYPVSMKYTRLFEAMRHNDPPATFQHGITRVLHQNRSRTDEFAFLAEATDVKYMKQTDCRFLVVGEEFSRKPYAIAVQKGSPLKESFSHIILKLLNSRELETLKDDWWMRNKLAKKCPREQIESDGISIHNIGGVFIVIFVGIIMACFTLIFEYWWYRKRDVSEELSEMALPTPRDLRSYFAQDEPTEFAPDWDKPCERPDINDIKPPW